MSDQSKSAISVKNVDVSYGKFKAVENVNLNVQPGEFFGLIGLNGAGKTTIIKTLLDLRPQNAGEIELFGQAVNSKDVKKRMAFLPERFEPPWFLSGLEFLQFSAKLYRHELADSTCYEYAERVSLDPEALKRRVNTYSKGMRQKLGLLGTVLTGCDLLILDEPMSGLDPIARVQVKDVLLETKSKGCTIFLSSHILADMDEICDRVAIMHGKTIQFTGPPAEFKSQTTAETLERAFLHFIEHKNAA